LGSGFVQDGMQISNIHKALFLCMPFKSRMIKYIVIFSGFAFLNLLVFGDISNRSAARTNKQAKTSTAWTASWSYDDRFVAIGNGDGELAIYQTTDWRKIKSWNFKSTTVSRIEWNPKYPILAIAAFSHEETPSIIQLYDVSKNIIIRNLPDTVLGRGVSWSPTGEEVAFVGKRGSISLFTKDGQLRKTLFIPQPGFFI
jgi:WD40 repeat protein